MVGVVRFKSKVNECWHELNFCVLSDVSITVTHVFLCCLSEEDLTGEEEEMTSFRGEEHGSKSTTHRLYFLLSTFVYFACYVDRQAGSMKCPLFWYCFDMSVMNLSGEEPNKTITLWKIASEYPPRAYCVHIGLQCVYSVCVCEGLRVSAYICHHCFVCVRALYICFRYPSLILLFPPSDHHAHSKQPLLTKASH